MTDSPLPETEDGRHDYVHIKPPKIQINREPRSSADRRDNRLAVWVAVGSLLLQLAAIAWTGGRLEQRITSLGDEDQEHVKRLDKQDDKIEGIKRDAVAQSNSIAATNATYAEILRRLQAGDERDTRIEAKIDDLRRNRR